MGISIKLSAVKGGFKGDGGENVFYIPAI